MLSPLTARALLALPFALGVLAAWRGPILAKLGVPLTCALLLPLVRGRDFLVRRDLLGLAAALVLSAVGDWFLSNRNGRESYFLAGIGFFFGAHLGYLICALAHGRLERITLATIGLGLVPYYLVLLYPRLRGGSLAIAVLLYLLVSCAALAGAAGMRLPAVLKSAYVAGIALLVFSDTVISFREFLRFHALDFLILPTYYLAHLCVTWSAIGMPKPTPPLADRPVPIKDDPARLEP